MARAHSALVAARRPRHLAARLHPHRLSLEPSQHRRYPSLVPAAPLVSEVWKTCLEMRARRVTRRRTRKTPMAASRRRSKRAALQNLLLHSFNPAKPVQPLARSLPSRRHPPLRVHQARRHLRRLQDSVRRTRGQRHPLSDHPLPLDKHQSRQQRLPHLDRHPHLVSLRPPSLDRRSLPHQALVQRLARPQALVRRQASASPLLHLDRRLLSVKLRAVSRRRSVNRHRVDLAHLQARHRARQPFRALHHLPGHRSLASRPLRSQLSRRRRPTTRLPLPNQARRARMPRATMLKAPRMRGRSTISMRTSRPKSQRRQSQKSVHQRKNPSSKIWEM